MSVLTMSPQPLRHEPASSSEALGEWVSPTRWFVPACLAAVANITLYDSDDTDLMTGEPC